MLLSLCCSVVVMLYCYCVALLLFVLSYVLIVCTVPPPPGVNPIAVDKYIIIIDFWEICVPLRITTEYWIGNNVKGLTVSPFDLRCS